MDADVIVVEFIHGPAEETLALLRLPADPVQALFAIAGSVLLLIFIGIRNAWDVVTFLTLGGIGNPPNSNK